MTSLTWDRHHGHAFSYDVVELGYNYRMDELRSALGRVQLNRIPAGNLRRRQLTEQYRQAAAKRLPGIQFPFAGHPGTSACHLMPALLPEGVNRAKFMEVMKQHGIQTSIHYPPIHTFSGYREQAHELRLPVTEAVGQREVTLPLYPGLAEKQLNWVIDAAVQALNTCSSEG
jgi:dTDP-4-amino-4,6-dideoxygalactose transaminase